MPPQTTPSPAAAGTARSATSLHPEVVAAQAKDILSVLLAWRFINALLTRTFFQPDEYFQALEPAWAVAFGSGSGAWLTWEWQNQLRSSLHPVLFAIAYKAVNGLLVLLQLPSFYRAFFIVALPKFVQSGFAAVGDFYTWKLATAIFGRESNAPWAALYMTVLNPWQWYCSTRTFSNSLETSLTIAALYYWPWEILGDASDSKEPLLQRRERVNSLRLSLVLAAIAVLLRPTNFFIWFGILVLSGTRLTLRGKSPLSQTSLLLVVREIILCGAAVLAVSVACDRLYFGFWAFPPYKFLYFNLVRSLAVYYGHMPWHYYLSQGLPWLTTTFFPFALVGVYRAALPSPSSPGPASALEANILRALSLTATVVVGTLSLISHKEARFIYPLLPILHILAAPHFLFFFTTTTTASPEANANAKSSPSGDMAQKPQRPRPVPPTGPTTSPPRRPAALRLRHSLFLANLLSLNILVAGYLSLGHGRAPIAVTDFLRTEFERLHPDALAFGPGHGDFRSNSSSSSSSSSRSASSAETAPAPPFALFLAPCHTTPWRSHLVYPSLRARALTCEPPLHAESGSAERAAHLDEADRFYDDWRGGGPERFLAREMWPRLIADAAASSSSSSCSSSSTTPTTSDDGGGNENGEKRREGDEEEGEEEEALPRYIIGFESIGDMLLGFFDHEGAGQGRGLGVRLRPVWSGWNGLFSDDWRRRGDLMVWDTGVYPDPARDGEGPDVLGDEEPDVLHEEL